MRCASKGKLVGGDKLAAGRVRHVRMRDGTPLSSDGPYAEAKDVIGGYFVDRGPATTPKPTPSRATARICGIATNWVELRPIEP